VQNRVIIAVLAAACGGLMGANAAAQLDPDPDGIGVYFDLAATEVATAAAEGEFVHAYLIATNISQPGAVVFWEALVAPNIDASPDDPASWAGYVYGSPVDSYNYAMNMPGDPRWHCIAMPDPPLPVAPLTLLAHLTIQVVSAAYPIALYVTGSPYYSVVGTDGPYHALYPSSGAADAPVAVINGLAPIATDEGSWSRLKASYR
jgi:hypothetical protein